MKKHRGLGRGLDALIPNAMEEEQHQQEGQQSSELESEKAAAKPRTKKASAEPEETDNDRKAIGKEAEQETEKEAGLVRMVRTSRVEPDRNQPRKSFDKEKLQELADSIKAKGLLEPIIVRETGDHFEIIAGERRWRACRLAELNEIPVIVKDYSDLERVEISLIENIQREDLNPIEEANAYRRLIDELAERVSKKRTSIANSMRLLKLGSKVQEMAADGRLSMGQARALIPVEDEDQQLALAEKIVDQQLSVRDVEKLIRDLQRKPREKKEKDPGLELIYRDLENRINAALGMKVAIKSQNEKSGKLEITYSNQDDLEKLMDKLMG